MAEPAVPCIVVEGIEVIGVETNPEGVGSKNARLRGLGCVVGADG